MEVVAETVERAPPIASSAGVQTVLHYALATDGQVSIDGRIDTLVAHET
jgi:hypothetical protein